MDLYTEAELYCAAFDWPVDGEVDWLLSHAPDAKSVLEPFCGNARYGPVFVERGLTYHGFDLSEAMLARAPRRDGMTLVHADARTFSFPGMKFDIVWCPINSIRHLLDDDEYLAHMSRVRAHLADGGRYVVELDMLEHDGPWTAGPDDKSVWTVPRPDGSEVRAVWCADRADGSSRRIRERARIERLVDGDVVQSVEHAYEMRMLGTRDWPDLVARAGFELTGVYRHTSQGRPPVELTPALDNTGHNFYFLLQ